ncbi:hypothetical protein CR513_34224, partial [Mucuna pruriens]
MDVTESVIRIGFNTYLRCKPLDQELEHSSDTNYNSKGFMILKLDLQKAYDLIEWDFVVDTLKR